MTQVIPARALALLAEDVKLLEQGTAVQPVDYTQYKDDPVGFACDVLHTSLWSKQREIADAVRDNYQVAVRSCNSMGKTHDLAAISLWWIFARGGLVLMTSATLRSARGQYVQGELRRLFKRGQFPTSAELFDSYLKVDGEFRLVAMVSSESSSLQGWHHAAGVLAIIDEASGVDRSALTALNSCVEDPARDRLLVAGNPLPTGNFFRGLFAAGSGWHQIHVSAFMCPAVTGEGEPPRVGKAPAWIEAQKKKGDHDPEYISRVLGEFPDVQSANALFDRLKLERAVRNHADGARRQAVAVLPPGEKTRFQNPRAKSGWALRDALLEDLVALPPSTELLEELLALRYEIKSTGKIVLGKKDAVRDLISRSPDLADVAMMALGGDVETATIGGEVGNFGF